MDIHIHLERKHAYIFALFTTLILGGIFVVAFGGNNPSVVGHTSGEIQGLQTFATTTLPTCSGTNKLTSDGTTLTCAADTDTNTQCDDQTCGSISFSNDMQIDVGEGTNKLLIDTPGANNHVISVEYTSSQGRLGVSCQGSMPSTSQLIVSASGGALTCQEAAGNSYMKAGDSTFTTTSSRKYKENIVPVQIPNILERMQNVPLVTFDFINGSKDHLGVIAEEFYTVFERGSSEQVKGDDVIWALWLGVQQLKKENDKLKTTICKSQPAEEFC